MVNMKITGLTSLTTGLVDRANDVLEIADVSASQSKKITPNALLGISGNAVGDSDSQTLTNKTLTSPTVASPTLSGTVAGTYTLGGTPTFPATVVTTTGSQTLTNKVLTSPTINSPSITNATLTTDAVTGFSVSNTGTIFGIPVTAGIINTANTINGASLTATSVPTAALANSSVTANKLSTGAASSTVLTNESTTSTSYVDLATVTDSVTVTIGVNGLAFVSISAEIFNTSSGNMWVSFVASGANIIAANDVNGLLSGTLVQANWSKLFTSLSPGSTTFKLKYRVSAGTGNFLNRNISVIPL